MRQFRLVATQQPVLILSDEAESLFQSREIDTDPHLGPVLGELLMLLQGGMDAQLGVMVVLCTNMKAKMDAAVLDRLGAVS